MKRSSFFLAFALLIVSFGLASAGSISLESSTGTWDDGGVTKIVPGAAVTFDLRVTNDNGVAAGGVANGFRVWIQEDPSGGTFTALQGDSLYVGWTGFWALQSVINYYVGPGAGTGSDTAGFGSAALPGGGMPDGFDDVAYRLSTGGIIEGQTLCVDSSYYPPTGSWLWAPGGLPAWDGPHCFLSETAPNFPPEITNPVTSQEFDHCATASYDFDAEDVEGDPIEYRLLSGPGAIDPGTGMWMYQPSITDVGASLSITVVACDDFGTDHCGAPVDVNLNFTNTAPFWTAGCGVNYNASNAGITQWQFGYDDDCELDVLVATVIGTDGMAGTVGIDGNGLVTYTAVDTDDGLFNVTMEVTDGDEVATCSFTITVVPGLPYQLVIDCVGEQDPNNQNGFVFQGQHVLVPVILEAAQEDIGGYDLLISYDASALSLTDVAFGSFFGPLTENPESCQWEYLTYRHGATGNCDGGCPSGLVRVVGIAETNNGPNHPECFLPALPAALFTLDFLVTNDRTFQCSSVPIRFFWTDCGDNSLSDVSGNVLFVSGAVYDGYDPDSPNGMMDIFDESIGFPTYTGYDMDCDVENGDKPNPLREVGFQNGCVFIACADSIDARGDLNLNNVAYEIADAVLYSRYFIYGIGVFTIAEQGQVAASDVNADGLALSVADLVYLIRVVVGDAVAYPKIAPVAMNYTADKGAVTVDGELGAAFLVVEGNATPNLLVSNMDMEYAFDANTNTTRVLVYSIAEGNSFSGHFINAGGEVISSEFALYDGTPVSGKELPANFELKQNYPNPFNPSTNIGFALPVGGEVTLAIYNITGQKVHQIVGSFEAGDHEIEFDASAQASGIYFYRLTTDTFTDTKKMVLLK